MSKFIILSIYSLFLAASLTGQTILSAGFTKDTTFIVAPGGHVAFPSIIRMPDDSLLMVYRKGASHVDISGQIMKRKGSPDGLVWSLPQVLVNTINIDDRDPSIAVLEDGRVMLNYFIYKLGNPAAVPPIPSITSIHVAFSSDNGSTFSTPVSIDGNEGLALPPGAVFTGDGYDKADGSRFQSFAVSAPALNVNNEIIIPAYGGEPYLGSTVPLVALSAPTRLYFFKSQDGGLTWDKEVFAENHLPGTWLSEPDLALKTDGSYLLHYRCADGAANPMSPGPLRQALMDSNLGSFIPDQDFPFVGHAPDLYRLSSGVLVSGFRHVNPGPSSQDICFVFSIDDGLSWSDTIRIQQGVSESGYPSFTQLANGRLLMSYYSSGGTSIKATIFKCNVLQVAYTEDLYSLPYYPFASGVENFGGNEVTLFPNPNNGSFTISMDKIPDGVYQSRILSSNGDLITSQTIDKAVETLFPFNLNNLRTGMYFVQLSGSQGSFIQKFMVSD